jgi:hypothetical protein
MYAVLTLVLLVQPPPQKKEDPKEHEAALRAKVIKEYALEPKATDTPLRKLQKERCIERAFAIALTKEVIAVGNWDPSYLTGYLRLHTTFGDNLAELAEKPADKVKCYEMRVENLKEVEKFVKTRVQFGTDPPQLEQLAKATRIDAELALLKLKESLKDEK